MYVMFIQTQGKLDNKMLEKRSLFIIFLNAGVPNFPKFDGFSQF
jgi:hypothetical protein